MKHDRNAQKKISQLDDLYADAYNEMSELYVKYGDRIKAINGDDNNSIGIIVCLLQVMGSVHSELENDARQSLIEKAGFDVLEVLENADTANYSTDGMVAQ